MLKLCGFSSSNYYNKVKLALLEKGVPFEEVFVPYPRDDAGWLAKSPMGKVPFIVTEHGSLCESQVILEYIEACWPTPALLPASPWAASKVREIGAVLDLQVELTARQLYLQAFFGGTLPEKLTARVRGELVKGIAAFRNLARFGPYVAGDSFTLADCTAYAHLPLAALASKVVYGEDLVASAGIDWKSYLKLIGQRPSAQRVTADRKADQQRGLAEVRGRVGAAS